LVFIYDEASLRYFYFKIGLPSKLGQKWPTSKSNISKKLKVPTNVAQILKKEQ
jgi:hypothetical protein